MWWNLALLSLLWVAGLVAHSTVLMGAMPGLTRRRAMTLNLTGSAVSNVLPLGGGLGVGLNYVMARRWGFSPGQFSLFTVLSNVWTVLAKAALPCRVAARRPRRADRPTHPGGRDHRQHRPCHRDSARDRGGFQRPGCPSRWTGARRAATAGPVASRRCARRSAIDRPAPQRRRHRATQLAAHDARHDHLLRACCAAALGLPHVLGSTLGPVAVLALFAFERALTALPITPGGSGVAEVATTALAIAFNGPHDKAVVAAGVLLYRAFTFGLEIPVGGVWLLGWLLVQRSSRRLELSAPRVALREAA